jgi:lipid II:glycine glycyltransferase (peptidoglycan interpeptide bridge formation enzyme)
MSADLYQSPAYQELLRRLGWIVEDLGGGQVAYIMRLKILPLVSFMAIIRVDDPIVLKMADQVARHYRSLVVRIAPKAVVGSKEAALWDKELKAQGYTWDATALVPPQTLEVDLGLSDLELLGQMKKRTRYNVRLSQRRGVTTKVVNGSTIAENINYLDEFYTLYHQNCQRIGMKGNSRKHVEMFFKAIRDDVFVLYAYLDDGELGAVASFAVYGDTITYHMNASTAQGRYDCAPSLLVWEGMLEGERRGCKRFDFDAVSDERYPKLNEEWKGFSRFKEGFGGQEVTYMGTYIKRLPFLKKARGKMNSEQLTLEAR